MARTSDLYQLQKTDLMWEKVRRRLLQIRQQLGESDDIKRMSATVTQTESELHQWQGRETDAELESQSLKNRIADTERRLMSGKVHNPKELEALQASIDALRRQRSATDDTTLQALSKVETLQATLTEQQATLAELEAAWKAGQGTLVAEEQKMKRNYLILKKQRTALAKALDSVALQNYEQLRKRKGGVAVTKIDGANCGACHVRLPTGVISATRGQGNQVTCPSCARILYYE